MMGPRRIVQARGGGVYMFFDLSDVSDLTFASGCLYRHASLNGHDPFALNILQSSVDPVVLVLPPAGPWRARLGTSNCNFI